jgi:hypothetical protein
MVAIVRSPLLDCSVTSIVTRSGAEMQRPHDYEQAGQTATIADLAGTMSGALTTGRMSCPRFVTPEQTSDTGRDSRWRCLGESLRPCVRIAVPWQGWTSP